jgi:HAE1 family hydrophobic/amphiphilic exporter-1
MAENGVDFPIRIRLDDFSRKNYEDIASLPIVNPAGTPINISQFATVVQDNSPSMLERRDRQPAVTLTAYALGRSSGSVAADVVSYVKKNRLPNGVQMAWGGDKKNQDESFTALGYALIVSFVLIYLVMVALYDNFIYPFVVLFSVPMAIIGAFLALNLSMNNMSLFSLLGLIMLMGLVAKNAILIVDFTNQLKAQGMPFKDALIKSGTERMRPILMTTLAMVIGMLLRSTPNGGILTVSFHG